MPNIDNRRKRYTELRSAALHRGWGFLFKDFEEFNEFLDKNNYDDSARIVRIDRSKPFSADNCKVTWQTVWPYEENYKDMANRLGMSVTCLRKCVNSGDDPEKYIKKKQRIKGVKFSKDELYSRYASMRHYAKIGNFKLEWENFIEFKEWSLLHGYKKGLFLVRKDIESGYTRENCFWYKKARYTAKHKRKIKHGK